MSEEYGGDFLFDMAIDDVDSGTVEWLGRQEYYRKWQKEQSEYEKKFPCIAGFLEGRGEVSLTEEEHGAVLHYLKIQQKKEAAEKREYYRFGHVHAQKYQNELAERKRCTADGNSTKKCGRAGNGKMRQGRRDLPGWLDGFIERLDMIQAEKLKKNEEYQRLEWYGQEILQKHPNLLKLLEGHTSENQITLSVEEQKAFEEYFSLQLNMDRYRGLELYKIGQEDFLRYFSELFC